MDCIFSERRMGEGSLWSDEEVKALINIWAEMNIQEQLETRLQTCIAIAFLYDILCILKYKSKPLAASTLPNDSTATKDASFYVKSITKVTVFMLTTPCLHRCLISCAQEHVLHPCNYCEYNLLKPIFEVRVNTTSTGLCEISYRTKQLVTGLRCAVYTQTHTQCVSS